MSPKKTDAKPGKRLGVAFIGSGFNARFHLQAFRSVRDADVLGVWSPNKKNAAYAADLARQLDVGNAKPYGSIAEMVADPAIDAIWLTGPNQARVENVEEIVHAIQSGKGTLAGIACEKPLARNVAEAKRVAELVKRAGIAHGYLENQVFAPEVETGRDHVGKNRRAISDTWPRLHHNTAATVPTMATATQRRAGLLCSRIFTTCGGGSRNTRPSNVRSFTSCS